MFYCRRTVWLKSDIEIVQLSLYFFATNRWKLVDSLKILTIPKVYLGVGEMEFMFCDL